MAEAVLEVVLGNLNSLVQKELGLFLGFDEDLERLASLFTTIKATLADAEERQFSNRSIKDWLQKLKEAAFILDDILDECAYEELRLEYKGVKLSPSNKVLSFFHPKHAVFRYKIAKKMKRISERLEEIADERTKFHLAEMVPEGRSGETEWRQTSSFIAEPQVYGRDEDRDRIIDFLVHDTSHDEDLSVYPITGLGGLGKTTLSQLIFNHERVKKHFEPRLWICVSEDFSLKRMTKAIIEAVSRHACEDLDLDPLQRKLQDLLQNKRYLLVLDDVWDDEPENWQRLKSVLACGALGASVLVTTRLTKVAAIMGTVPPYELSKLSDNDCWRLFKQRAFVADEVEQEELVVVGKEIVKKCGGVPLAAKVLGGLLRFKREVKEWLKVKESNIWSLTHSIMPALRISYLNLPINLRQCFAYCAIFSKDEWIEKQYLIELWMANGFISSDGNLDVEDVGDGVWNELYWRSFFQDIEKDEFGKVRWFKMHDFVHDLAQFVGEEVCCITNEDDIRALFERKRIHHFSNYQRRLQLHQVKYSRLLQLSQSRELSSAIGDCKHLRYLNLSHGSFYTLPESLCKLLNLQILRLDYCYYLEKLPDSLVRLKALQKLSLKSCWRLSTLSPYIGKLNSLSSLSMYLVGEKRGFLLAELGPLKLKRDIEIKHLERVKSVNDAKKTNMSSKQLNRLKLRWKTSKGGELEGNDEEVLEALQPCSETLQSLTVEGYKGVRFPEWMSSPSFTYLTYLELRNCENCVQLPVLGKLPSLKKLYIIEAKCVNYLCSEDGVAFMALEDLSLCKLSSLIRLSSEDGEKQFPCLSTLHIEDCPNLSLQGLQHMTTLKRLILMNLPDIEFLQELRFGDLPLLRELSIVGCDKLMRLPTSLSLSHLEELTILDDNTELKKRCKKESGEDWPIIAHIPRLKIR